MVFNFLIFLYYTDKLLKVNSLCVLRFTFYVLSLASKTKKEEDVAIEYETAALTTLARSDRGEKDFFFWSLRDSPYALTLGFRGIHM